MGQIRTRDQGSAAGTTEPTLETRTRILESTKASIDSVEIQALEAARRGGFRERIVGHIGLAVREIMVNAVIHGNGCDPYKKVVVTISRTPNKLRIEISDEGDAPEGLLKGSDRGVYLARTFMDELYMRREPVGWTTVIMVKSVHSAT
jgi:serine/threonine-protein kinase RsbW